MDETPPDIRALLGRARPQWDALLRFLDGHDGVTRAWKRYAGSHGWQLKVTAERRALLYLMPREGHFMAATALRPPAIAALRAGGVPDHVVREIEAAKASSEGKPARVEVRDRPHRELVERLVTIKLASLRA